MHLKSPPQCRPDRAAVDEGGLDRVLPPLILAQRNLIGPCQNPPDQDAGIPLDVGHRRTTPVKSRVGIAADQ